MNFQDCCMGNIGNSRRVAYHLPGHRSGCNCCCCNSPHTCDKVWVSTPIWWASSKQKPVITTPSVWPPTGGMVA